MRVRSVVLLVLGFAPSGLAACPEDPDAMNRKGRELASKERWADAERIFASLAECRPTSTAFLSLAISQFELGRFVQARKSAEKARALAVAAKQPLAPFDEKLKEVDAALPRVVLRLPAGTRDVHPRVDGVEVGLVNGTEVFVDPGEHKLVVSVEGKPPFETTVVVARGSIINVRVDLGEDGPPPKPGVPSSKEDRRGAQSVPRASGTSGPLVLGALGVVVGAAGGYYTYEKDREYHSYPRGVPSADAAASDADRQRTIGWGVVAVGALATSAAVVWWASLPGDATVSLGPRGAAVSGRF